MAQSRPDLKASTFLSSIANSPPRHVIDLFSKHRISTVAAFPSGNRDVSHKSCLYGCSTLRAINFVVVSNVDNYHEEYEHAQGHYADYHPFHDAVIHLPTCDTPPTEWACTKQERNKQNNHSDRPHRNLPFQVPVNCDETISIHNGSTIPNCSIMQHQNRQYLR